VTLILRVQIDSKGLLRDSLNLRQKHEIFANGPSSTKRTRCARAVIIRENVFSTSTAFRQVFIGPAVITYYWRFVTDRQCEQTLKTALVSTVEHTMVGLLGAAIEAESFRWFMNLSSHPSSLSSSLHHHKMADLHPSTLHCLLHIWRYVSSKTRPKRLLINNLRKQFNGTESSELISQGTLLEPHFKTEIIWWPEIQKSPAV